jgi:hypothetical protein
MAAGRALLTRALQALRLPCRLLSGSLGRRIGILVGKMNFGSYGKPSDISEVNTDFHAK